MQDSPPASAADNATRLSPYMPSPIPPTEAAAPVPNGAAAVPTTAANSVKPWNDVAQARAAMDAVLAQEELEMIKMPAKDFTFLGLRITECDQNSTFLRTGEIRVWVIKDQNGKTYPKRIAAADWFRLLGYSDTQAKDRALREALLNDGIANEDILDLKTAINAKKGIATVPIFINAPGQGEYKECVLYQLAMQHTNSPELKKHFAKVLAAVHAGASTVLKDIAQRNFNNDRSTRFMQSAHEAVGGATVNITQEEECIEDAHGNSETTRQTNFTGEGMPTFTHNEQHLTMYITPQQLEALDRRIMDTMKQQFLQANQKLDTLDAKQQEHGEMLTAQGEKQQELEEKQQEHGKMLTAQGEKLQQDRDHNDKVAQAVATALQSHKQSIQQVVDQTVLHIERFKKNEETLTAQGKKQQEHHNALIAREGKTEEIFNYIKHNNENLKVLDSSVKNHKENIELFAECVKGVNKKINLLDQKGDDAIDELHSKVDDLRQQFDSVVEDLRDPKRARTASPSQPVTAPPNVQPSGPESTAMDMSSPQMGPPQMGPPQMDPPQMDPPQMDPPQMGPPHTHVSKPHGKFIDGRPYFKLQINTNWRARKTHVGFGIIKQNDWYRVRDFDKEQKLCATGKNPKTSPIINSRYRTLTKAQEARDAELRKIGLKYECRQKNGVWEERVRLI